MNKKNTPKPTLSETLLENLKTISGAIIIAVIIRSFLFEPFHIPSGSMKDGLLEGDFIIVSKFSYGYSKYSFPFGIAPIKNRIFSKKPKRGDVAVFRLPSTPSINYIKRLIGLPGDKIQMINGKLHINNQAIMTIENGIFIDKNQNLATRYQETLPNGKEYNVLNYRDGSLKDNTPIYTVPEGHYFFLGDNRDNSQDSRFIREVGMVPERNLVGRAKIIFLSTEESLIKFWKWHKSIRFSRIFDSIN